MKRIRLYLLAFLVSFSVVSYGDNLQSITDYTHDILGQLTTYRFNWDDGFWQLYDLIDEISSALVGGDLPNTAYWTELQDSLRSLKANVLQIRNQVDIYTEQITMYLPMIEAVAMNTFSIDESFSSVLDAISELDGLADSLQDIIDYAASTARDAHQTALNTDGVATEDTLNNLYVTVQNIHGMLAQLDLGTILHRIEGYLQEFSSNWQYLFTFLSNVRDDYYATWHKFFYDYELSHGYPTLAFQYYNIMGSPDFVNGYSPNFNSINNNATTAFEYLNYAIQSLLDITDANNSIFLFIAKYITTNGQSEVLSDFQDYSSGIIADLEAEYSTLRDLAYDNSTLTFNPNTMPLGNVKSLLEGLEPHGYSALRSQPVIISGFNALDSQLPSYFDFQYDLTPMQSLIEIARVVFSTIWILLFCSMFLWMCFKFRKLYNWLFSTMVSNAPNQSALTNMPI